MDYRADSKMLLEDPIDDVALDFEPAVPSEGAVRVEAVA